jgi:broad specificity phosphatase PhoE
MSETLQHLILVRHGESEGDVRRAAWKSGSVIPAAKNPEHEELTVRGEEQSRRAGTWIAKNIIDVYGIEFFDGCFVSSALRSEQSAIAMDLPIAVWQDDKNLDERNRGKVRGLRAEEHKHLFPESYMEMNSSPLHWTPPEGESIIQVAAKARKFLDDIEGNRTVLAVTHRDWMWAAMQPLEGLSQEELLLVDTNQIHNAQVVHYTSIDPDSGEQAPALLWKRSVDPMRPDEAVSWKYIGNLEDVRSSVSG